MSEFPNHVASVAQVIQLAVAPVFLLAGVGALLGVLSGRLARIVDHFSRIERELGDPASKGDRARNLAATISLSRRARLIHWAIILCATCYLLVCLVVVILFVGHEMGVDFARPIGGWFIAAMLALIAAVSCFLREITLATSVIENLNRSALTLDRKA